MWTLCGHPTHGNLPRVSPPPVSGRIEADGRHVTWLDFDEVAEEKEAGGWYGVCDTGELSLGYYPTEVDGNAARAVHNREVAQLTFSHRSPSLDDNEGFARVLVSGRYPHPPDSLTIAPCESPA